jgi:hypothetical protein
MNLVIKETAIIEVTDEENKDEEFHHILMKKIAEQEQYIARMKRDKRIAIALGIVALIVAFSLGIYIEAM